MRECPNGHEVNDLVKFCPKCGAEIQEKTEVRFCKNCGNERDGTEKFCPMCGTPYDDIKTTQPSQSLPHYYEESDTSSNNMRIIIAIIIVVFGIIVAYGWLHSNPSKSNNHYQEVDTDSVQVIDSADTYVGKSSNEERFAAEDAGINFEESDNDYVSSSPSLMFRSVQDVYELLRYKKFVHSTGSVTLSYDDTCQFYINGEWNSGIFEVLRFSSDTAIIQYHSPSDGTMRLIVTIVGNKIQITDPLDGSVYYQK